MLSAASRQIPRRLIARYSKNVFAVNNDVIANLINQNRWMSSNDDLPYHLVVGMPALSPTMETGTIANWKVKEGDEFGAGDSIAEIETDKATIDFEAQDEGFVAKILMPSGSSDINVGVPIIVTVEEAGDVAAFANFVPDTVVEETTPEPVMVEEIKPAVVEANPPPAVAATPTPPPAPVVAASPTPAPVVEEPSSIQTVEEVLSVASDTALTVGPAWGNLARVKSPLAEALSVEQKKYIETYGSTGQTPL